MGGCRKCGSDLPAGVHFCGACGAAAPVPPRPATGVRPGHRWRGPGWRAVLGLGPRWALAGAVIVVVVVVGLSVGGGSVNGLAASYSCTSSYGQLQGSSIDFTDRGNALGRGLSGSIDLPAAGTTLQFSDGVVDLRPRGARDRMISFGNLQVDASVDVSAVAQMAPNGDIVWGDYLTCAP